MSLNNENSQPQDNALYAWSGGCDSTLMIAEALDRYDSIKTISMVSKQLGTCDQEREARRKIIAHFKRKKKTIDNIEIPIDFVVSHKEFAQAVLWLTIIPNIIHNHQDIAFGYIRTDDWLLIRHTFREAYKKICEVCEITSEIHTPLFWYTKGDVIYKLASRKLLQKVWYCEEPRQLPSGTFKPCKSCKSCYTHRLGELELTINHKLTYNELPKYQFEKNDEQAKPVKNIGKASYFCS